MDLKTMVKTIFSPENLAKMTEKTGLEAGQVQNVLGKAVPFLANPENKEKGEEEAIRAISEEAGVGEGETKSVLSSALPLLMGMLGGGSSEPAASSDNGMIGMLSGLLGNMDMGDMLGGMFGGGQEQELTVEPNPAPTVEQAFTQAEEPQEESSGGLLGMLGSLFKKN